MNRFLSKKTAGALCTLLLCFAVLQSSLLITPAKAAPSAKSRAVAKVKADYQAYAAKVKSDYQRYKQQSETNYRELTALVQSDYQQLMQKARADYRIVEKQYDSRAADAYYGEINRNGLAMDRYYGEIHRYGLSFDRYYGEIYRYGLAMDRYYGEVYRIGLALDRYYGEVYRSGLTLHYFERNGGNITNLYKTFAKIRENTQNKLNQTATQTVQKVNQRRAEAIKTACISKKNAMKILSDTRKEITGTGIEFGTFGIDSLCASANIK